jgi:uncharacterized membrane protein
MVLGAIGIAIGGLRFDLLLKSKATDLMPWFGGMGAEAARKILTTTASTMITVASIVFSITIVALQLASSQFGPRLLRNFMIDRGTQIVFGTFTGSFVYCLLILATIRASPRGFVPVISVWFGLLLGVVGIGVLIYFIHHIAQAIRVERVVADVAAECETSLNRLFPEQIGDDLADDPEQRLPADFAWHGSPIRATCSGYIRLIDAESLMNLAHAYNLVVQLERRPGDFVCSGTVLVRAYPADRVNDDVARAIAAVFAVGVDRTPTQDADFSLRQLLQIALRALSPGINDPFTATECINRLTQVLRHAARRGRPSRYRFDTSGILRVVSPRDALLPLAVSALDPIARAGGDNGDIVCLLIEAIKSIASDAVYENDRDGLFAFARAVKEESEGRLVRSRDKEQVERVYASLHRLDTAFFGLADRRQKPFRDQKWSERQGS